MSTSYINLDIDWKGIDAAEGARSEHRHHGAGQSRCSASSKHAILRACCPALGQPVRSSAKRSGGRPR